MTRWLVALLALAAMGFIAVMVASFGRDPHAVPFMMRGGVAPAFALDRIDARGTVALAALRGKPVVMNFWATWCGPCEQEDSVLAWGAGHFEGDVHFIGIVFEDTEESARRYLQKHGARFPQLSDPRSRVAVDYGVSGVPETYFIDAEGRIVDKHLGPIDADTLRRDIDSLLRRSRAPHAEATP